MNKLNSRICVETQQARILTEIKILDTTIGIVVLSAGVGNDIIGWTLLALSVALVNAGSGLQALYILLTAIAWTLVILIPVKRIMLYLARCTGSIENGPSPLMMTISIMLMFTSAFFTDVIGTSVLAFYGTSRGFIVFLGLSLRGSCHIWRILGGSCHSPRRRTRDCPYRKTRGSDLDHLPPTGNFKLDRDNVLFQPIFI